MTAVAAKHGRSGRETVIGVRDVLQANGCPHQQAAGRPRLVKNLPSLSEARGGGSFRKALQASRLMSATITEPQ